ncbi:MAG: hypothetical protein ACFE8E_03895 [Candidatus Hodarchaeota archaeon]
MVDLTQLTIIYPWLNSFEKYHKDMAPQDPDDFISNVFSKYPQLNLYELISKFFDAAFENLEEISGFNISEISVELYLVLRILIYMLSDNRITNRVANLYSKLVYSKLKNENDHNLFYICHDLNIDIKFIESEKTYRIIYDKNQYEMLSTNILIYFIDYLKLSTNLKDEYRKLINNPLQDGYIYIQKRTLARLLQEYVRSKFLDTAKDNKKTLDYFKEQMLKVKDFKELYDNILSLWDLKKESFEYSIDLKYKEGKDILSKFPPCIREILLKAQDHQNLIHIERLFLVFFLHALEYPIDKIIDIFSTLPDFDHEKTKYQVEFAKKKGYVPHSCSTLQSLNLCMASKYEDNLCLNGFTSKKDNVKKKITHPLFYLQYKQFINNLKEKKQQIKLENESKD